ncbi:MAG TPA: TonB-dependent receptor [Ohtaekwangia sp.]|uniref:SusC/RagA family TonB-linked outer membrane protein n=1 Tax=Ohtaekwangia sp. TaxID=2066019 RepID=UPI002F922881
MIKFITLIRYLTVYSLFMIASLQVLAQGKEVKGLVTSSDNQPIPGVSIVIKGTTSGTSTDSNGNYTLTVPDNEAILVYSFIGFATQEKRVGEDAVLNITMTEQLNTLQEIVVVGYGTQKREDITGSVSSVPKERLAQLPVTNVLHAMEGTTAGVYITQNSSAPGSSASVLVRGVNSITANTSPLIVVDGVPFSNMGGTTNDINPNDIESIEILKDASAVAIYGTRGSSGVILITTKRGKSGKPSIRYNTYAGMEYMHHTITPLKGAAYSQKYLDYSKQRNQTPNDPPVPNQYEFANYLAGKETDWIDAVSQQGYIQDHNLSISGGTESVKYFVSGAYQKQQGVLKGYEFKRASFRSNLDVNITPWLSAGTSLFYANNDYGGGSVNLTLATQMSPYGIMYDKNGNYEIYPMRPELLYKNPLLGLNRDEVNKSNNLNGTFYIDIEPTFLRGLKYKLNTNYSYLPTKFATYSGLAAGQTTGGAASINNSETSSWLVENILFYEKDLGKHHIDLTGLYSAQETNFFTSTINANTFINDGLSYNGVDAGAVATVNNTSRSNVRPYRTALLSQMGRVNYSFGGKYLLTLTARRDGYSAFGSSTSKYGFFPSVALGWNVSEESFLKNIEAINNLKLRVSYGRTGNQAVGAYQTITSQGTTKYIYNGKTYTGVVSSSMQVNGRLGNSDLNWETTTGTNVGVDFTVLDQRISGTVEVYKTKTKDLLLLRQLPNISGYTSILDNLGAVDNKGIEVTLRTVNLKSGKFTWSSNINYGANRNKIVSLYGDNKDDIGNKWFIGKPLRAVYDYRLEGVWQNGEDASKIDPGAKPGDLKFYDKTGDGKITSDDREYLGSGLPKWTGGIINTFDYGNLHLSIFIQTFQGAVVTNSMLNTGDQTGRINTPSQLGYWTEENKSNTRPSLAYTNPRGYAYPVKQDYTRIKDITLSYTFPQSTLGRIGLGGLTAYISGRNLYTFTDWVGWDPENDYNSSLDFTGNNYPYVASYVMGLNINLK